ncbi:DUF2934 domain-containing protein [Shinella sp. G-2]|uniref:DUF2934 domain-containing protein n=1 Tax=Shinella sp. G-2 TaxID=3133141 RepID=UPI003CFF8A9B
MVDFEELVRTEAYHIWESAGRPDGCDREHWQMALLRVQVRMQEALNRKTAVVVPLSVSRVVLSSRKQKRRDTSPNRIVSA